MYKHYHEHLPFSLRRISDSRCVTCELLPPAMREVAFLSTDLCPNPTHRWRTSGLTLRYDDEHRDCVQCSVARIVHRNGHRVVQEVD